MSQVNFKEIDFPTILDYPFDDGYNVIGLDQLGDDNVLVKFVTSIAADFISPDPSDSDVGIDWDRLLLIKADKAGFIDRIYSPTIFKDASDNVVIKSGDNTFSCSVGQHMAKSPKGKDFPVYGFKCGSLVGEIAWAKDYSTKTIVRDGVEIEVEFQQGTVQFVDYSQSDLTYYNVPIFFAAESEPDRAKVEMAIKTGESITEFLALAPSGNGGGTTYKLQDLISDSEGKITVDLPYRIPLQSGFRIVDGQYGESYIVTAQDGKGIWTRGTASAQLATGFEVKHGDQLVVSKAKRYGDGKWQITCGLRHGEQSTPSAKAKAAKPTATPAPALDDVEPF